jgi:hypothetical protein
MIILRSGTIQLRLVASSLRSNDGFGKGMIALKKCGNRNNGKPELTVLPFDLGSLSQIHREKLQRITLQLRFLLKRIN